jgi:hypothetical protein
LISPKNNINQDVLGNSKTSFLLISEDKMLYKRYFDLLLVAFVLFSCSPEQGSEVKISQKKSNINPLEDVERLDVSVDNGLVTSVVAREDKIEAFECIDCHDEPKKEWSLKALQEDGEHDEILEKYKHANVKTMDCMTCHSLNDRNNLHSLQGEKISYNESFKLCAQCHTNKFKDWKNGAHGKRVGFWNKERTYLNCTSCHDPHMPSSAYPKKHPVVDSKLIRKTLEKITKDSKH